MNWTPEPWRFGKADKNGDVTIEHDGIGNIALVWSWKVPAEANAYRIVACVNSCAGLTNDDLASGEWMEHQDVQVRALVQAAERTLAALGTFSGGPDSPLQNALRAALEPFDKHDPERIAQNGAAQ